MFKCVRIYIRGLYPRHVPKELQLILLSPTEQLGSSYMIILKQNDSKWNALEKLINTGVMCVCLQHWKNICSFIECWLNVMWVFSLSVVSLYVAAQPILMLLRYNRNGFTLWSTTYQFKSYRLRGLKKISFY